MYYSEKEKLNRWAKVKEKAVDFFFPMSTYCIICGKAIDETRTYPVCDHCIRHVRWGTYEIDTEREYRETGRKSALDSASVCMLYGIYERQMIFELKYGLKTYVARVISKIMEDRIKADKELSEIILAADCIVPVPASPDRLEKRGFNQTEKIGRHLSRRIGIPLFNALLRLRESKEQSGVSGNERYANLKGAFGVRPELKEKIKGKTVILLDDVYTTGSTANLSAAALKEAGAAKVYLLALASSNDFLLEKNTKI